MLGDLGLARRSGALVLGFDNVLRALESPKPPKLLIEASDGAADGKRKLYNAAHAQGDEARAGDVPYQRRIGLGLGTRECDTCRRPTGRVGGAFDV